ncbi:MAG TPA: hypothetical protein VOA41_17845 [Candidatus Dormibacteraeota bacterium]|nr:hypothetical protein [Candidatus Dormibacteraeota bacterium]
MKGRKRLVPRTIHGALKAGYDWDCDEQEFSDDMRRLSGKLVLLLKRPGIGRILVDGEMRTMPEKKVVDTLMIPYTAKVQFGKPYRERPRRTAKKATNRVVA